MAYQFFLILMKLIFSRGPSLQLRLFIAILLSCSLLMADSKLKYFSPIKASLNTVIEPIQYIANLPRILFEGLFEQLSSKEDLVNENTALKSQILILRSNNLQLEKLRQENQRLRALLGSPLIRDEKKMVAQIMAVNHDPYSKIVMIDKGYTDGVYKGQPVINEKGVVGQVVNISAHNSWVLLIIDNTHEIPVQVVRNDIRTIASGDGLNQELELEYLPSSVDLQKGDMLVTSGLGGVFPEGYPVGYIDYIDFDNRRAFGDVKLIPSVDFNRLRYVLLVWASESKLEVDIKTEDESDIQQQEATQEKVKEEKEEKIEKEEQSNE